MTETPGAISSAENPDFKTMHLLVVDDNETNRYSLEKILGRVGYRVTTARDGKEGMEVFRREHPDLVITDLDMPVLDGFEFAAQIRSDPKVAHIPIIFISATYKDIQTKIKAMDIGGNDYLAQPIDFDELLFKVKAMLRTKKLYDELHESRETFRKAQNEWQHIFDSIQDFVYILDTDHNIVQANQALADFLGTTPDTLMGKRCHEVIHGRDKPCPNCPHNVVTKKKKTITLETYDEKHNRHLLSTATPLFDNDELQGTVNFIKDITDIKQAEEDLKRNAMEWDTAMDASEDAHFLLDLNRHILRANKKFYQMTGSTPQDAMGRHITEIVHHDGEEEMTCPVCRAQKEQRDDVIVLEADDRHNPTGLPTEYTVTIVKDDQGHPLSIFMRVHDLTNARQEIEEQKRIADQLRQAQKMEAIGTLAGGIAHDFNNLLGIILGYTELAKDDAPSGSPLEEDLEQVIEGAYRARDLVKQILAFSRQAEIQRIPMQMQSLVKEALKMLRSSLPTTIEIKDDVDSSCGVVLADPTHVHQILMNLCTNADHAMEETGGVLKVSLQTVHFDSESRHVVPQLEPGEYIELMVSDTGTGIGPDVIDKIFDPFFTTKEIDKGTGMGLSIIHGIISEYGGAITVESELGKGTTFHVYFPIVDQEEIPVEKEAEIIPMGRERILFIDDEELLAKMGKDMLERLGYHVTMRLNSLDALTAFQNNPEAFDLIITDQTMPSMTGTDLARRMLQIRPDIPIILCTGFSNLVDEESAKLMGIREFAMKPLTKGKIATLLRKVLN